MTITAPVRLPDWAANLKNVKCPYKVVAGGRGSAKSRSVAILLLLMALERKLRIVCLREVQESLADSSKQVLEDRIEEYFPGEFIVQKERIISRTGSVFTFSGMNGRTARNILSREGVNIFWFEQAEYLSEYSAQVLFPTVREEGSELWLTFNPRYESDPVWTHFMTDSARRKAALVIVANWLHNPFWNAKLEQDRLICLQDTPELYDHIYMGSTADETAEHKVMTGAMVRACMRAWTIWTTKRVWRPSGRIHVGLDIADSPTGDWNAVVVRQGPAIIYAERWRAPEFTDTAKRAWDIAVKFKARKLWYDAGGGFGPGVRGHFVELRRKNPSHGFLIDGLQFGGAVTGPDEEVTGEVTNKDYFMNRGSQMGWALRQRAINTGHLLSGMNILEDACLFIKPDCAKNKELFIAQMQQPIWEESTTSKIRIEKTPKVVEGSTARMPSPDFFDSARLALASDSEEGLNRALLRVREAKTKAMSA